MSTPPIRRQTRTSANKRGKYNEGLSAGNRAGSRSDTLDADDEETKSGATTPVPGNAQFVEDYAADLQVGLDAVQIDTPARAAADDSSAGAQKRTVSNTSFASNASTTAQITDSRKDALIAVTKEMLDEPLGPIEQLSDARDIVEEVKVTYTQMSDFLADPEHEDYEVEAVSFSKLKDKHLKVMGVKLFEPTSVATEKRIFSQIDAQVDIIHPELGQLWEDVNQGLNGFTKHYRRILKVIAHGPEARARVLTDIFVIFALDILAEKGRLCMAFLELHIAGSRKPLGPHASGPYVLMHQDEIGQKFATFLTGSVDYAVITSMEVETDEPDAFDKAREELYKRTTVDDILASKGYNLFKDQTTIHVAILEEKKKSIVLEACRPQVVGESLTIMLKLGLKRLPWCLTNGVEWIFGAVEIEGVGILQKRRSYQLPTMTIDIKIRDLKKLQDALWKVFKMLMCWVSASTKTIFDLFDGTTVSAVPL